MNARQPGTYRICFLLIDGFALMSYAATEEPLRAANILAGRTVYEMHHAAVSGDHATSSSGARIEADVKLGRDFDFDLVLVMAGGDPVSFHDEATFSWLRALARHGVRLGGVSGGPVILAAAGVMEGRRMTVHWEHAGALAEIYPDLLIERTLFVIDRDRITSAGGTAPLDLIYAFLAERHGPGFARQVGDWFMQTEVRPSGGPQRAGLVERHGTTEAAVIRAIEAMENHIADPLRLAQLAELSGTGPRQLNRLFRERLGRSTMEFYRRLRIDMARSLLRQSTLSLTEIALATGFATSAHFSSAFREALGVSPSAFRKGESGTAAASPRSTAQ
ncbi:GlxA family transcriptional regulator [Methyloligella sp. 2.7D]|uniref:GlxA family transcriptional regulator n=1 Tax=unclassified Methyloligella TaxID=2625955 RepID=UPI00157C230B|nr:GlxA family transcriptional regulator [Methyloligella sp. GL2]QKP78138.1 GlxA family transcriptional regulator [Methyloligella sp. GL2]